MVLVHPVNRHLTIAQPEITGRTRLFGSDNAVASTTDLC
jgi:hypothetical protein